jgi:hypothetical protein
MEPSLTTSYVDRMKPFRNRAKQLQERLRTSHKTRVEIFHRYNERSERIETPVQDLKFLPFGKEFQMPLAEVVKN